MADCRLLNAESDSEKYTYQLKWKQGLILSFLIHLCLLISFLHQVKKPEIQKVLNVSLEKLNLPKPKQQIVTPSEKNNQKIPEENSRLSDLDNVVKSESIKRGDSLTIKEPVKKEITLPDKQRGDFLKEQTSQNLAKALSSISGSPDHLPDIKDGEITLLNTKASVYAVFVRRVAIQVFNQLKQSARYGITYNEVSSMQNPATITATLDANGKLLHADIAEKSSSQAFNKILLDSVKNKASDPHPPPAALNANNQYIFIFQSIMQSQRVRSPSPQGYSERRWIMLRVGLE